MFVFSVKTTKKQMISIIVCVVMLIAILVVAIAWPSGQTAATGTQPYTPVEAASDEARIGFLKTLGYEASPSTAEVKEVLIPDEFDEVFQNYNTIQRPITANACSAGATGWTSIPGRSVCWLICMSITTKSSAAISARRRWTDSCTD